MKKDGTNFLALVRTLLRAAESLGPDQILYWSRNEKALKKILESKQVSFITKIEGDPILIEAESATTRSALWKKYFVVRAHKLFFWEKITLKDHPATEQGQAHKFQIHFPLTPREVIQEMGGEESVANTVFTYGQIVRLVQKSQKKNSVAPAPLDWKEKHYFPMRDREGKVFFAWATANENRGNKTFKWRILLATGSFLEKGKLYVKDSV